MPIVSSWANVSFTWRRRLVAVLVMMMTGRPPAVAR
jgi:hypothetical protein